MGRISHGRDTRQSPLVEAAEAAASAGDLAAPHGSCASGRASAREPRRGSSELAHTLNNLGVVHEGLAHLDEAEGATDAPTPSPWLRSAQSPVRRNQRAESSRVLRRTRQGLRTAVVRSAAGREGARRIAPPPPLAAPRPGRRAAATLACRGAGRTAAESSSGLLKARGAADAAAPIAAQPARRRHLRSCSSSWRCCSRASGRSREPGRASTPATPADRQRARRRLPGRRLPTHSRPAPASPSPPPRARRMPTSRRRARRRRRPNGR